MAYYRARYYDPQTGRFLREDPIHFWAGVNFYTYAHNRSTRFRDPSGKLVIGVIVGGVIGGIEGGMGAGLQGGSTGEIVTAIIIGAAGGAVMGLFDPTEGALTVTQIALIGGAAGFSGDVLGQAIGNLHKPRRCRSFNVGEAVGAGLGGLSGGYMAGAMAVGAASVGAGELAQALMGGGISAVPATLGAPTGAVLGPTVGVGGCACE
jgi:hypothetical protein